MSTFDSTPGGEILVCEAPAGSIGVDGWLEQDAVWLTQRQMSELFETSVDNVGLHLKNVFGDGALEDAATTEDFSVVQSQGGRRGCRNLKHYNLVLGYAKASAWF